MDISDHNNRILKEVDWIAWLLDGVIVIPVPWGSKIRIGLSAILGYLFPTSIAVYLPQLLTLWIVLRGRDLIPHVKSSVLCKMMTNILIGALIMWIPFLGPTWLMWWQPNKQNAKLLHNHIEKVEETKSDFETRLRKKI